MKAKTNGASVLKIEKGVPLPKTHGCKKGYAAILRAMEVGDSVVIPGRPHVAHNTIRYIGGNKETHTCRAEGEGFRVWRIK